MSQTIHVSTTAGGSFTFNGPDVDCIIHDTGALIVRPWVANGTTGSSVFGPGAWSMVVSTVKDGDDA